MCPYYLDGDLTGLDARSVIPVATAAYRYAVAVATVQFSRAAEKALGRPDRHEGRPTGTGLSKLNSMLGLEPGGMPRGTRGAAAARVRGTAAGPARFGRRSSRAVGGRRSPRCGPEGRQRVHGRRRVARAPQKGLPRKEVIQPHLPVRLPCYDFTPITSPTFDGSLP